MNRSPMRIIEPCVYALLILGALAWMVAGGRQYSPPLPDPPAAVQPADSTGIPGKADTPDMPPPVTIPKGEVFPGSGDSGATGASLNHYTSGFLMPDRM